MFFLKYPKMKTLFKLENKSNNKWGIVTDELLPETAPLHYLPLVDLIFLEKIDGTGMGIHYDRGDIISVQKRNDICNEGDKFYLEMSDKIKKHISSQGQVLNFDLMIYGELCGTKIQKGGNYFNERRFLVFDIYSLDADKFLTWDGVKYICSQLGLETVPELTYDKTDIKIDNIKEYVTNLKSVYNNNYDAEGVVIKYRKDTTYDKRWVAKIRKSDF